MCILLNNSSYIWHTLLYITCMFDATPSQRYYFIWFHLLMFFFIDIKCFQILRFFLINEILNTMNATMFLATQECFMVNSTNHLISQQSQPTHQSLKLLSVNKKSDLFLWYAFFFFVFYTLCIKGLGSQPIGLRDQKNSSSFSTLRSTLCKECNPILAGSRSYHQVII
jgi:hypothetical protein